MTSEIRVPRALLRAPDAFGGRPDGAFVRGIPRVADGKLAGLRAVPEDPNQPPLLVLPALCEAHCHLDKCHTIDRLGPVGGDLIEAITKQSDDKVNWSAQDLRRRALRGLHEAHAAGCTALRTHVDWGVEAAPPTAWHVFHEVAQDTALTMQCAALTGIDQMADPDFAAEVAQHVARTGGVLGSFILYHKQIDVGLRNMFEQAARFGLALDFHVDEGLGDYTGLEQIADMALHTGFDGPILCGHCVSLIDKPAEDVQRIADKLARAGISVCALPTTNLYLQGRQDDGTPDRRGLTRLRELDAAGVRCVVASDNVGDAFCPTGAHDPMQALYLACLAAHLDPPLERWLPMITTQARASLGLPPNWIEDTPLADLRAAPAQTTADLIAGRASLGSGLIHSAVLASKS